MEVIHKVPKVCIYLKLYSLMKKPLCIYPCPNFSYREEISLTEKVFFFLNVILSGSGHRTEFQISTPLAEAVDNVNSFLAGLTPSTQQKT